MKLSKKCPECGGTEISTTKTQGGMGTNLLPQIGGFLSGPQLEVYVCTGCGYHQLFVPDIYLKEVKTEYKQYSA